MVLQAPALVFDVQIRHSWLTVRFWTHVFCGFTTTLSPSYAMRYSTMPVIPFWVHASISDCLMGRDASLRSVSPRQNFANPPPAPPADTTIPFSVQA